MGKNRFLEWWSSMMSTEKQTQNGSIVQMFIHLKIQHTERADNLGSVCNTAGENMGKT